MPYTYPPAPMTVSGDVESIHYMLQRPTLLSRRVLDISRNRYISDALLTGRFTAVGGGVQYESDESLFSNDDPRAVAPLGEYPMTTTGGGAPSVAKTVNWGQDTEVSDASIARLRRNAVDRGLSKLVNQNIRYVDSVALSAIATGIAAGNTTAAAADWSTATAAQILKDVMLAKANMTAQNKGFDPDVVVIDDINHANAMAAFVAAGYLPRENNANNPVITGDFPVIQGMRWLASPNVPVANVATLVDTTQLGGMADENLGSPGYVRAADGVGIETAAGRINAGRVDGYWLRARRVTVPVILEPYAAWEVTGL